MDTVRIQVGPVWVDILADDRIGIGLRAGKNFEPNSLARWAEMCQPGTTVLDVGCYSGVFSIAAAKLGATPIGVEPLPFMRKRIEENCELNGVAFRVIPAAASDRAGQARIGYNDRVPYTSGASLLRSHGPGLMVDTFTLDELEITDPVSAIKIDVERHEPAVIRGGAGLIAREHPAMIIEFLDDAAKAEIVSLLPGYSAEVVDRRNLVMTYGTA